MTPIESALKSLGFIDNEIAIYLALLKLGSAPASILGKRANLPRTTAKFTCEQLQKKNIINSVQKGNTVIYSIDSPEKLFYLVEQEKTKVLEKENELNRVMGDMKAMLNPQAILPKVQFYEGIEGVARAFGQILAELKSGEELLSFAKILEMEIKEENLYKTINNFVQKRVDKGVRTRVIASYSKEALKLKADDQENLRETRLARLEGFDFPGGELFIFRNTVYSMSMENNILFGYTVRSHSISKMYRALFEIAWRKALIDNQDYQKPKQQK